VLRHDWRDFAPAGGGTVVRLLRSRLAQGLLLLALIAPFAAAGQDESDAGTGRLEPSYQPAPPPEKEVYSTEYLFAITRAVADSTLVPAAQVPLYFLTIPTDVVFLPIELIAGFFPGD
jgi:hypothetical protein